MLWRHNFDNFDVPVAMNNVAEYNVTTVKTSINWSTVDWKETTV